MGWPIDLEALSKIKVLFLDFDGVLTDGCVYVNEDGKETVRCSRRDSLGLEMLKGKGVLVAVISKEKNPVVLKRCEKLNIQCFSGIDDKAEFLKKFFKIVTSLPEETAYVGDDINDLFAMSAVGMPIAVGNAVDEIKHSASYVTKKNGGEGAVREVCDLILRAKEGQRKCCQKSE